MKKTKQKDDATLADDLLVGAKAIAAYLGLNERQVFHQAANGGLPAVQRMGKLLIASKQRLRRYYQGEAA
jgi:hypothetical protein